MYNTTGLYFDFYLYSIWNELKQKFNNYLLKYCCVYWSLKRLNLLAMQITALVHSLRLFLETWAKNFARVDGLTEDSFIVPVVGKKFKVN